jgi:hypothetical protein
MTLPSPKCLQSLHSHCGGPLRGDLYKLIKNRPSLRMMGMPKGSNTTLRDSDSESCACGQVIVSRDGGAIYYVDEIEGTHPK